MKKKKILIAMTEIGDGHKSPEIAIQKSIEKLFPRKYETIVIDLFKETNFKFLFSLYSKFWVDFSLSYPRLFNILYNILSFQIKI